jgi:hypothetical protein
MLAAASLVVVMAFVLDVRSDQRVVVRGLTNYAVPETCFTWAWLGIKCPGCGLTRSIIFLAQGDWESSLRMHRIGWLLAVAILLQFPYRGLALAYPDRTILAPFLCRLSAALLIVLLLGNWLLGLLR